MNITNARRRPRWNVDQRTGCWEWTGARDQDGYGRIWVKRVPVFAHRVAWADVNGPIPQEMTVDHLCFNPSCVNPAHLRLLTRSENARRQRSAEATHCKNGHAFTDANTYWRKASGGRRDCRMCVAERARRYRAKRAGRAA
jgi:hypothetical protein